MVDSNFSAMFMGDCMHRVMLLIIVVFSGVGHASGQLASGTLGNAEATLNVAVIKGDARGLELEIAFRNETDKNMLVAVEPMRFSGDEGPYIDLKKSEKATTLSLGSRVYSAPPFFAHSDNTSVSLRLIQPDETFTSRWVIEFPAKETMPPFDDGFRPEGAAVSCQQVDMIEVEIGYFTDPLVWKVASARVRGWILVDWSNNVGPQLYELQHLARASVEFSCGG